MSRLVPLTALDGRDPLGFLAALGVARLLGCTDDRVRLSFDPNLGTAQLHGIDGLDEVLVRLVTLIELLPTDGLMKGLPPVMVPPSIGDEFSDPARMPLRHFGELVAKASNSAERSWVRSLWTDLGHTDKGMCAVTPFYAPTGRQTLRTAFEKSAQLVFAAPERVLREALESWRRVDDFTGENLDFRAVRRAAEQPDGKAIMSGVPGATWLALSAIPFFPMGGDGVTAKTLRWQRLRFGAKAGAKLAFSWPVWTSDVDVEGVGALLAHPAVDRAAAFAAAGSADSRDRLRVRDQLHALSIERVFVARRRQLPGGKSAGVLVPVASWG